MAASSDVDVVTLSDSDESEIASMCDTDEEVNDDNCDLEFSKDNGDHPPVDWRHIWLPIVNRISASRISAMFSSEIHCSLMNVERALLEKYDLHPSQHGPQSKVELMNKLDRLLIYDETGCMRTVRFRKDGSIAFEFKDTPYYTLGGRCSIHGLAGCGFCAIPARYWESQWHAIHAHNLRNYPGAEEDASDK